jgi:hypothetical protein
VALGQVRLGYEDRSLGMCQRARLCATFPDFGQF